MLDEEDRVNKNQPDYFLVMKKCLLEDPECRQNRTLEEIFSSEQEGNLLILKIKNSFYIHRKQQLCVTRSEDT